MSWRKEKPAPSLTVYVKSPDKQLCLIQRLNKFIEMTKYRRDPSRTQLLLRYTENKL